MTPKSPRTWNLGIEETLLKKLLPASLPQVPEGAAELLPKVLKSLNTSAIGYRLSRGVYVSDT